MTDTAVLFTAEDFRVGSYYKCLYCENLLKKFTPYSLRKHVKGRECSPLSRTLVSCYRCLKRRPPRQDLYTKDAFSQHLMIHAYARPRHAGRRGGNTATVVTPPAPDRAVGTEAEEAHESEHNMEETEALDNMGVPLVESLPSLDLNLDEPLDLNARDIDDGSSDSNAESEDELPVREFAHNHAVEFRQVFDRVSLEKIPVLRVARHCLEYRVTETELKSADRLCKDLHNRPIVGTHPVSRARVPLTVRKLREKTKGVLENILTPLSLSVNQGHGAFLSPIRIISFWLSNPRILEECQRVSDGHWIYHLNGTIPTKEHFSEFWDGNQFFNSVQRTRHLWQPNLPGEGVAKLMLHFGIYYDDFTVSKDHSEGVITLCLISISRELASEVPSIMPMALFRSRQGNTLAEAMSHLKPSFDELARGLDYTLDGRTFRLFAVTSVIQGDILAVRALADLKKSSNLKDHCLYCFDQRLTNRANLADNQCGYGHSKDNIDDPLPVFSTNRAKTSANYQEAYAMVLAQQAAPRNMAIFDSVKVKIFELPGIAIPDSIAVDMMHNELLGYARKHLRAFLEQLCTLTRYSETTLCQTISVTIKKLQKLNVDYFKFNMVKVSDIGRLSAYAVMRLISWSRPWLRALNVQGVATSMKLIWLERKAVIDVLLRPSIPADILGALEAENRRLNTLCCRMYWRFCTIKTHVMEYHLMEQVHRFGTFRNTWNFRQESLIYQLKKGYANINNQSIYFSIFDRYLQTILLQSFFKWYEPSSMLQIQDKVFREGKVIVKRSYAKSTDPSLVHFLLQIKGLEFPSEGGASAQAHCSLYLIHPATITPRVPETYDLRRELGRRRCSVLTLIPLQICPYDSELHREI